MARASKTRSRKPTLKVERVPLPDPVPPETTIEVARLPQVPASPIVQPEPAQEVQAVLVEPDVLHPSLSVAFLVGARLLVDFMGNYPQEVATEPFVRGVLARVCAKDPRVKFLLGLDPGTGEVLGHSLSTIETDGANTWVFCWQAQVVAKGTGIVDQMIAHVVAWAKPFGAASILMATQVDPQFWQQRYGFHSVRTVMRRAI